MNSKNKIYLSPAGGALAAICFFLPWVKVDCFPQAASGADIGGIVWLVLIAALVIIGAFFFFRNQNKIDQSKKIIMIGSWSALAVLLIRYISFASSDYGKIGFTLQYGVFGVIIGFIGALVGVNYIKEEQPIEQTNNSDIKESTQVQRPKEKFPAAAAPQTYKKIEPQIIPREKSLAVQQLVNTINSFDLAGKIKKHKKKIIIGVVSFFVLLIAYNILFVTSPVTDGKKAGEIYNEYQNSLLQDQIKVYGDFLNKFDSYKFLSKTLANERLGELSNQRSAKTNEIFSKQNETYSKLRNRYVDNQEKMSRFDNTYSLTLGGNNNSDLQSQQSNLYSQIQNKISSIIAAEPDTNKIKNDLLGKSFVKGRMTWRFQFLSEILNSEIINVVRTNNYREYNLGFTLYDSNSGDNFKTKMIVSYNYNGDNWIIANSTMTDLQDITKKIKY